MQYGLALPTGGEAGDPRFLLELAERAEAAGWDGIFPEDYVWYQRDPAAPTTDTFTVLAAAAVRTSRVRLGIEVTPLTRLRPWVVARQAAAVDQLSNGRMILGVGIGDTGEFVVADASFTRFGEETDARRRGELLDEGLEILAGLWSGEPFSFRGRHFTIEEITFLSPPGAGAARPDLDRRRLPEAPSGGARAPLGRLVPLQASGGPDDGGRRQRPPTPCRRPGLGHRRGRQPAARRLGRRARARPRGPRRRCHLVG